MTVRSDKWIRHHCLQNRLIDPFEVSNVRATTQGPVISYGLSSYGYDIRCGGDFKIFTNVNNTLVDPKNFKEESFVSLFGEHCIIPPNSFVLACSLEYIRMPRDTIALVTGKSTYARTGVIVNCTPLEPEWEGHITLELSNTTPLPAKVYVGEGIAQLIFLGASEECEVSYRDRKGKYQGQRGVTLPRV